MSRLPPKLGNADFTLIDWKAAGLNVPSGVKAQLATIESTLVRKIVDQLNAAESLTLDSQLRHWLRL